MDVWKGEQSSPEGMDISHFLEFLGKGLSTGRATTSYHSISFRVSVGMHGDAIAVCLFLILMIMNGFVPSGFTRQSPR